MNTAFLRALAAAAALLPGLAGGAALSLESALELALQRSESVRAARAALQSATESALAAGRPADPTVNVGVDNLPVIRPGRLSTRGDSMTMKRIGVSQEWLSRDKRVARTAAAEASVRRGAVQVQAAEAETRLQTALAFVVAFYAGQALEWTAQAERYAREALETARARLAAAAGASHEVLALAAAQGAAEDETAQVRQEQGAALVQLERRVGVRPAELLAPPDLQLPSEQEYVALHPEVLALGRAVDAAAREAAVTASERRPNWTWGVSYGQRTGYPDMVSFGVSIPIPLSPGERQDRETAARLALVDKAEADLTEATRAATAEYRVLVSDSERLQARIDRYRAGVLTPARQRVAVALAAYASNQSSLSTVFEARQAEVEAQRKLLSLERDRVRIRVQLRLKPLASGEGA
jgi:outer membrane protein TolC